MWADTKKENNERYFVLLEVIAIIGEKMGAAVLKNVVQVRNDVQLASDYLIF